MMANSGVEIVTILAYMWQPTRLQWVVAAGEFLGVNHMIGFCLPQKKQRPFASAMPGSRDQSPDKTMLPIDQLQQNVGPPSKTLSHGRHASLSGTFTTSFVELVAVAGRGKNASPLVNELLIGSGNRMIRPPNKSRGRVPRKSSGHCAWNQWWASGSAVSTTSWLDRSVVQHWDKRPLPSKHDTFTQC